MQKIRAHLRIVWNRPSGEAVGRRSRSPRGRSRDRKPSKRQRSVSFDTDSVTIPRAPSSRERFETWPQSARGIETTRGIETYFASHKSGNTVKLARLQRRISVSYPLDGSSSRSSSRSPDLVSAVNAANSVSDHDEEFFRGRSMSRETSRTRDRNTHDRHKSLREGGHGRGASSSESSRRLRGAQREYVMFQEAILGYEKEK